MASQYDGEKVENLMEQNWVLVANVGPQEFAQTLSYVQTLSYICPTNDETMSLSYI